MGQSVILNLFKNKKDGFTIDDMVLITDYSRTTVHNLTNKLCKEGLLYKEYNAINYRKKIIKLR